MSDLRTAAVDETALAERIDQVEALRAASDGPTAGLLADVVWCHLDHLWEHGGRNEATAPGRRPEWIYLCPPFICTQPSDDRGRSSPG